MLKIEKKIKNNGETMKKNSLAKTLIVWVCVFGFSSALSAQDMSLKEADENIDQELRWLKAESIVITEIATKTGMDAELVPGMVTVLQGKELEDRGIRTVYEALSLVPGINTHINSMGDKQASVRGLGGSFFSGNLKLMTDGIVMNDALNASGYATYNIPVRQIDRIEIIRGPGSVVYGEYAYAGVINVITRKNQNHVYGYYDSNEGYGGGGNLCCKFPEKDFSLNLGLSGFKSDGPDVEAGKDRLYEGFFGLKLGDFSNAPGTVNEAQKDRFANLVLKYKDFSLTGQYISGGSGDYFGIINVLPSDNKRVVILYEHKAVEAAQSISFSDFFKTDVKAGCRLYKYEFDRMEALPPITGLPLPDGSTMDITPADGSLLSPYYEEREFYGGADFIWKGINRHTLLLGMKYSETEMQDIWVDVNTADEHPGETIRLQGQDNWLAEDQKRSIFSTYLQDMINITDRFDITLGLRYDRYNDMGDYLTPRASAVWRLADHHILKAQYSESVRPPSFTELYSKGNSLLAGNDNLDSAHIRSYELGYIYRNPKITGRLTLFYSELKDNIEYPKYADSVGGYSIQYENIEDAVKTKGFELDFQHRLRHNLRLDGNLSFCSTEDDTGEPFNGAADWLANFGLIYKPADDYSLSLQYRYVGKRHRAPDDNRDKSNAYNTVNLTAGILNIFTKGLTLRAGVSNLFDAEIKYP
ncbi:MAG: hypothetical protein BWK80_04580, partial [Desulfobacteraceae bacterium IS3]